MDSRSVGEAYSSVSGQYIELFDLGWNEADDVQGIVRRHLGALAGPVLDLGCGPGHWSAYLHSLGVDVAGVDIVPEFVAHARSAHPGPTFRLQAMTELDEVPGSVAGALVWFSTIHLPPGDLGRTLASIRQVLSDDGVLVAGFFDSDDDVAAFDHKVVTAFRWPVDTFSARLSDAGFAETERVRWRLPDAPDRRYAAIAARAVRRPQPDG